MAMDEVTRYLWLCACDCDSQVGAPPDVLERLTAMAAKLDARPPGRHEPRDPELDQFMVGAHPRSSIHTQEANSYNYKQASKLALWWFIFLRISLTMSCAAQEAYCNMLVKYREELTRPIDEAMEFLKRVEAQLDSIAGGGSSSSARLSLAGKIDRPHKYHLSQQRQGPLRYLQTAAAAAAASSRFIFFLTSPSLPLSLSR